MASKFDIEITVHQPQTAMEATMVKVIDHDQDEDTGWCQVKLPSGEVSPEAIVAHAFWQHDAIAQMLQEARQVAYAVYLNEDHFDIHDFFPRIEALTSRSGLQAGTDPVPPAASPSPRM